MIQTATADIQIILPFMSADLVRDQKAGGFHFLTFSCFRRLPHLATAEAKDLFEPALERIRKRYNLVVAGYVVMPEHVHLLVGEPAVGLLSRSVQALKLSVAKRRSERPFWQPRYYDFNVRSEKKRVEKLRYMHHNPVVRGLAERPEDWAWSSYRHHLTGAEGAVEIESHWTAWRRQHGALPSQLSKSRPAAPS